MHGKVPIIVNSGVNTGGTHPLPGATQAQKEFALRHLAKRPEPLSG